MKEASKNYYDLVCGMEEISLNKRFLPYSVGTPKKTVTSNDHYERANFVYFCDSHVDLFNPEESLDNVRRIIDYANGAPVRFDALINSGDAITPSHLIPKSEAKERAKSFFDTVKKSNSPFVYAIGNHDSNDSENFPENVFTSDDWSELFFDFAEKEYGIVRQTKKDGTRSTWHYIDIEKHKIRIISLDALTTDRSVTDENGFVKYFSKYGSFMSGEQLNWLADTALNFDDKEEKDWGVILTFHMFPVDFGYHLNSNEAFLSLCTAFKNAEKYSCEYVQEDNHFFDIKLCADFSRYAGLEKKPHFICMLLGHDHEDKNEVINGINVIWSLNSSASSLYGDARVMRYPGTPTQNAFDILNIDTRNRKIRMFRYGAGVTCYGIGGDRFLPDGLDY